MWNGTAQFVEKQPTDAADLELYTDASSTHESGAYFQGDWFHHDCNHISNFQNMCLSNGKNCCCKPNLGPHLAAKACQILL